MNQISESRTRAYFLANNDGFQRNLPREYIDIIDTEITRLLPLRDLHSLEKLAPYGSEAIQDQYLEQLFQNSDARERCRSLVSFLTNPRVQPAQSYSNWIQHFHQSCNSP